MKIRVSFYDPDDDGKTKKKHAKRHHKRKAKRKTKPKKRRKKPAQNKTTFTLDWVSELGWDEDPFSDDGPLGDFSDERQQVNLFFIKKRRYGFVKGPEGSGKTALLQWLASELEAHDDFTPVYVSAAELGTDEQLRIAIADIYRRFGKKKPITRDKLVALLKKRAKKHMALLIDDADALEKPHVEEIKALAPLVPSVLFASRKKAVRGLTDQLGLVLEKRSAEQYQEILRERIEAVGGSGFLPFTPKMVSRMAEKTKSTKAFMELARETAITIALERVHERKYLEEHPEAAKEKEERKEPPSEQDADGDGSGSASGDTPQEPSGKGSSADRREIDELIESLGEDVKD